MKSSAPRKDIEAIYSLSPLQKGLLFHSLNEPNAGVYVEQISCVLDGHVEVESFEQAWQLLVDRHAVFRTAFVGQEHEEPLQVVLRSLKINIHREDWSRLSVDEQDKLSSEYAKSDRLRGFEMFKAPLMRLALFELGSNRYRFIWTHHHIILDGWCIAIILDELLSAYEALRSDRSPELPERRKYSEYISWLQRQDYVSAERFWRRTLNGISRTAYILPDVWEKTSKRRYRQYRTRLSADETARVQAFARRHKITVYTVVHAAWALLLSRYSGESKVVFGMTVSGRSATLDGVEGMVGPFINTLPAYVRINVKQNVTQWLSELQAAQMESRQYEHSPLADVKKWSGLRGGHELFDSIVVYENTPVSVIQLSSKGQLNVRDMSMSEATHYLVTVVVEPGDELVFRIGYDEGRLSDASVERIAARLVRLVKALSLSTERNVGSVELLEEGERVRLLEWSGEGRSYATERCIHEIYEERARSRGEEVAVEFDGKSMTYGELERRSNQVARHLRKLGVGPERMVGLCVERSMEMVVGILGILKAGGAYVSMDPEYPRERLEWMLEDSAIGVVLTQRKVSERVSGAKVQVVEFESIEGESEERVEPWSVAGNAAYMIYTSGSTGKPKGVVVTHQNVVRLFRSSEELFRISERDVWTLFHSYAFDFSVWELWGALLYGGRVIVVPQMMARSPEAFYEKVVESGVTMLSQTPSAFRRFMQVDEEQQGKLSLRYVVFGGEALEMGSLRGWFERHGDESPLLVNMYGITETTVHVTYRALGESDVDGGSVVGRPLGDLSVYILDPYGQLTPIGVSGELYVGGGGVSRGYLGRSDLTGERFLPDPYSKEAGGRLYRTGDLGRYLSDGNIEYLGRIDQQVKIRGYRIELGEIESALVGHAGVREAVVVAREEGGGDKRLVGYVTSKGSGATSSDLRAYLKEKLPEYMVPSAIMALEKLPLTPNGKVDRKALPAPEARADQGVAYVAPSNEVEETIASIWKAVLKVDKVGRNDNFFDLGGDSLRILQVISRARKAGLEVSVQQMYRATSLSELVLEIDKIDSEAEQTTTKPFALISKHDRDRLPEGVEDAYPMTALQQGMVFHTEQSAAVYHDVFLFKLDLDWDERALRNAIGVLVSQHEILRTGFDLSGFSEPLQLVYPRAEVPIQVQDCKAVSREECDALVVQWAHEEPSRPFDWVRAPLMRMQVFVANGYIKFGLSVHHAILDGWSVATFNVSLFQEYLRLQKKLPASDVAAPVARFRDYVALEQSARKSVDCARYWAAKLSDVPRSSLPKDGILLNESPSGAGTVSVDLPPALIKRLTQWAGGAGVPLKSVLLAAHLRVIGILSGTTDVVTGLVTNGRPETVDGERALGLFLNTVPFRQSTDPGSWMELVKSTFRNERELLEYRRYPYAELQRLYGSGESLFDSAFNYVDFHVIDELKGLPGFETVTAQGIAQSNLPFTIHCQRSRDGAIILNFEYDKCRFSTDRIRAIAGYFETVIQSMDRDGEAPYHRQSVLSTKERNEILIAWNSTQTSNIPRHCVHELFKRQVERTPQAIAILSEKTQLTYRELDEKTERLASCLRTYGVGPETVVGAFVCNSVNATTAVLSILKAGGVYVPLDRNYPDSRLKFVIEDCGIKIVLADDQHEAKKRLLKNIKVIDIERTNVDGSERALGLVPVTGNAAYIIYTSGSTGTPKGVVVSHAALVNHLSWRQQILPLNGEDKVLQLTALGFDPSLWELFGPLVAGASLVIAPEQSHLDIRHVKESCSQYGITVVPLVPSSLEMFLQDGLFPKSVRRIYCGGEELRARLVDRTLLQSSVELVNLYGPTETTIAATEWMCEKGMSTIPIGRPVWNTHIYILDAFLEPVPTGVQGEIYIGGAQVARGYLGRTELTAERFLPDPHYGEAGARMYRTGDLGRYWKDGTIEYLGRVDHQVKIRGYRIELGEVESALLSQKGIREAAVVVREDGPGVKRLVGYVASDGTEIEAHSLRVALKTMVPEYMVPSAIVVLKTLPLSPSGKVDRRALPTPTPSDQSIFSYEPPRSAMEQAIAEIWSEVLKRSPVGVHDHFFDLGGDSLLATQVISRIRRELSVDAPLRLMFEEPTLVGLSRAVERLAGAAKVEIEIERVAEGPLELSYAQERLFFIDQLEPNSVAYNITSGLRVAGALDRNIVEDTLNEIVLRHESLRTIFHEEDGRPLQIIVSPLKIDLEFIDLGESNDKDIQIQRWAQRQARTVFSLSTGPLVRVGLVRIGENEHVVVFTMHHIVSDGWSVGILIREFVSIYKAFAQHRPCPLQPLPIQYADYASWQRRWLVGEVLEKQLSYWRESLQNPPTLQLPTDRVHPTQRSYKGSTLSFEVPEKLSKSIRELGHHEHVTTFMTLLASFGVLLYRCSGQSDVLIGTPIASRNRADIESLIGFFVNTLVLRLDFSGNPNFREMLKRSKEVSLGAYAHQDVPFERLVDELKIERDLRRTPLFQVMFTMQNAPVEKFDIPGLAMSPLEVASGTAKFDLTLTMAMKGDVLIGSMEYNTDIFDPATINRMVGRFVRLLGEVVTHADDPIATINLLDEEERVRLLEWSGEGRSYATERCIHEIYEERARSRGEEVAVEFDGKSMTYGELERRSNQVARHLRKLGVGPERMVGLCVERSMEMVVGILGILKAGGAYVSMDPEYPRERLEWMLEDSAIGVVLTQRKVSERVSGAKVQVVEFESIEGESEERVEPWSVAGNAAYMIYTSGSTGKPKGVVVTHQNVVRLFRSSEELFRISERDVWTLFHSYAFDFSVWELWGALLYGGRVIVVPQMMARSPEAFYEKVVESGVTMLSQTPSAFRRFMQVDEEQQGKLSLRYVVFGGEALEMGSLRGWFERHGDESPLLVNMYGITETTVHVTYRALGESDVDGGSVVGRPLGDLSVYILDPYGQLTPIGVSGELYVGGGGVSRGYLGRSDLTGERFLPDPYSKEAGGRLYRTGDLGRYLSDGNIEYLGRIDQQVKIRGYRIELGEIESALVGHAGVREAVVVAREEGGGDKRLVGYVTSKGSGATSSDLRAYLKEKLPEYMVPSAIMALEKLPLTPNGKIDRKALPNPERSVSEQYVAPRTETERRLAEIWQEVLQVERVGAEDNFFELGGHSLLATQVVSRVRKEWRIELSLRAVFEEPTLGGCASQIERGLGLGQTSVGPPIERVSREQKLALSFAQQRLWFLDQLEPGSTAYTIMGAVRLKGKLHVKAFEESVYEIVGRHESLRTRFVSMEGGPIQQIEASGGMRVSVEDLSESADSQKEVLKRVEWLSHKRFDLAVGPLVRTTLLRLGEEEHIVLFSMHHIVSDGWSLGVFVRELAELYRAFCEGRPSPLPELKIQYADYAQWQRGWLQGEVLEEQLSYWRNQLGGAPAALGLPTDHIRPQIQTFKGSHRSVRLSKELSERVKELCRHEGSTPFMVLLAAFATLLSRYSGQDDIVVGSPVANRNRVETEGLIGVFVNTLALRVDLGNEPSFRELVHQVRETTLGAYTHQDVPFERLVDELNVEREMSRSPLFQVMFVLQNAPLDVLELPGLKLSPVEFDSKIAKFDLTLELTESERGFVGSLEYNSDLFEASTIERMNGHYIRLLEETLKEPNKSVFRVPLMSAAERRHLLQDWNAAHVDFPKDKGIHQLFEEQVKRSPNAIAVELGDSRLSYHELNTKANQLAHYLMNQGIGPETFVGICADRSLELVIAILGILKAGGAYVPLDPNLPHERLEWMLKDSRVQTVLAQGDAKISLSRSRIRIVDLEDPSWQTEHRYKSRAPVVSANAAYMIYTSGSTGKPKGVVVTHQNVVRLFRSSEELFRISERDVWTLFHSYAFDFSVWELWGALLYGGRVIVVPQMMARSPEAFYEKVVESGVTMLSQTPSAFRRFMQVDEEQQGKLSLRYVVFGGEALEMGSLRGWFERHGDESPLLVNMYGITETTVHVTYRALGESDVDGGSVVGRPLGDLSVYILDPYGQLTPIGVSGELYVGGGGVSRGYLGRSDLTGERFLPDPYSKEAGGRLYRTGDLGRYLSDGNIEYLGRIDQQVKIRGYRIELGEIESALVGHAGVREAVVVAREEGGGDKRLVGYVTSKGSGATSSDLRAYLKEKLPEYMVPSAIMALEKLPLTPNGKVDRKALPAPEARADQGVAYVAPSNEVEETIASIWKAVLKVDKVGRNDNFFDLGGDSLLLTVVHKKINEKQSKKIGVVDLFRFPTVQSLAEHLAGTDSGVKKRDDTRDNERLEALRRHRADRLKSRKK